MRTDEIAPRVALTPAESAQNKKWSVLNPAFAALLAAVVAGVFVGSAFQNYAAGVRFREWWREALSATVWFGIAIVGLVRGLNRVHK